MSFQWLPLFMASVASAAPAPNWSQVLHDAFARNLNRDARRIARFSYYSDGVDKNGKSIEPLAEIYQSTTIDLSFDHAYDDAHGLQFGVPHSRLGQILGDSKNIHSLGCFSQSHDPTLLGLTADEFPRERPFTDSIFPANGSFVYDKLLKSMNAVIVIVPGMGSEYLPIIPFADVLSDYQATHEDQYDMLVARIDKPTQPSKLAAKDLASFLHWRTPLFDEYADREIIFISYDFGVNTLLQMLADPANADITNRTRMLVGIGGFHGGLPITKEKMAEASKAIHALAQGIATTGEILAQVLGSQNPAAEIRRILLDRFTKMATGTALDQIENSASLVAPVVGELTKNDAVSTLVKTVGDHIDAKQKVIDLSQKISKLGQAPQPGPLPSDAPMKRESVNHLKYRQTLQDYSKMYSNIMDAIGSMSEELASDVARPITRAALDQIQRKDGKQIAFFTLGGIADPVDFRVAPDLAWDGKQISILAQGRQGEDSFSWDDLIWYGVAQPGFYADARYDGLVKPHHGLLDRLALGDKEPLLTSRAKGVVGVDLGVFRASHWSLAVGPVLGTYDPFPRRELFEALMETLHAYEARNP